MMRKHHTCIKGNYKLQEEILPPAVCGTNENQSKSSNARIKTRIIIRTHEKRHAPRSQMQAMGSLAADVNKKVKL